jgi:urease alpha subunit
MSGDFAPAIQQGLSAQERAKVAVFIMSSPSGWLTLKPKQILQAGALSAFKNGDDLEQSPTRDFLLGLGLHADYGTNFQVDESRFMVTFGVPWGSVAGFKSVTYFASSNDETVNGDFAYFWWNLGANAMMKKVTVQSSHTGYKDYTDNWTAALRPALAAATSTS